MRVSTPPAFTGVAPASVGGLPLLRWIGCHGGAGVSTLARLTQLGVDGGTGWPAAPAPGAPMSVVLVCRLSATGTYAAAARVEHLKRHIPLGMQLLGLVGVAASPKRAPKAVLDRWKLISGWVPEVWRVGWVEAYLAVDDPVTVGPHPDMEALRHHLGRAIETTGQRRMSGR